MKIAEPIIYDDYNGRVRADQDCIGTLTTNCGNDAFRNGVKIIEPRICAMRGRNPDNPSDRTAGSPTEQRLEIGSEEMSNTLTTVQKDNLVVEPKVVNPLKDRTDKSWFFEQNVYAPEGLTRALKSGNGSGNIPKVVEPNYRFFEQALETLRENEVEEGDTIDAYNKRVNKDGVSPTLTTRPDGFKTAVLPITQDYRIRKLTPDECFRLQGVKQEDFERVAKNQSTSALYHEAGDSICCTCLMAIFGQLLGVDYTAKINELVGELKQ